MAGRGKEKIRGSQLKRGAGGHGQGPDDLTEHILHSRTVYRGKLLEVNEDRVRLPDGTEATREYALHPGAVVIIPWLEGDRVLLERQFRYPLGRDFIELPAGKLEPGESPLKTAQRELLEETGYEAVLWRPLATLHPCIGYSNERIELFLAKELRHVGHSGEAGEFLEVFAWTLREALEAVETGRITDVKTMLGIFWLDRLAQGKTGV